MANPNSQFLPIVTAFQSIGGPAEIVPWAQEYMTDQEKDIFSRTIAQIVDGFEAYKPGFVPIIHVETGAADFAQGNPGGPMQEYMGISFKVDELEVMIYLFYNDQGRITNMVIPPQSAEFETTRLNETPN